jgi:hypothetical protein
MFDTCIIDNYTQQFHPAKRTFLLHTKPVSQNCLWGAYMDGLEGDSLQIPYDRGAALVSHIGFTKPPDTLCCLQRCCHFIDRSVPDGRSLQLHMHALIQNLF